MARAFSLSALLVLCICLLSSSYAAVPGRSSGDHEPELPSEKPPPAEPNSVDQDPQVQGHEPPFNGDESKSDEYEELAEKVADLLKEIADAFSDDGDTIISTAASPTITAETTSKSNSVSSGPTALPTDSNALNATLGCEIYQSYNSICPSVSIAPYTGTLVVTYTVDAEEASTEAMSARASCLCYSASYYVPAAYDNAAFACAEYNGTATSDTLVAVATSAAETNKFCSSIGNVRISADTATFGQFTPTATPTASPAAASTPTSTNAAVKVQQQSMVYGVAVAAFVLVRG